MENVNCNWDRDWLFRKPRRFWRWKRISLFGRVMNKLLQQMVVERLATVRDILDKGKAIVEQWNEGEAYETVQRKSRLNELISKKTWDASIQSSWSGWIDGSFKENDILRLICWWRKNVRRFSWIGMVREALAWIGWWRVINLSGIGWSSRSSSISDVIWTEKHHMNIY